MERDPEELPPLPLKEDEIFLALSEHEVDYVLIGGGALMVMGVGERETFDLDIVPEQGTSNLEQLGAALRQLDARVITRWNHVDEELIVAPSDFEPEVFEKNRILHVLTSAGRMDILAAAPGADGGFDHLRDGARARERAGVVVTVAGVEDLIRMKEAVGRPKDLEDLKALRAQTERDAGGPGSAEATAPAPHRGNHATYTRSGGDSFIRPRHLTRCRPYARQPTALAAFGHRDPGLGRRLGSSFANGDYAGLCHRPFDHPRPPLQGWFGRKRRLTLLIPGGS
ncbi:MAG: DUF6036 family nucleotidyltransferase [Candidatus Dormibacteria bacterium]